jgi:superfamily II DNA/RNA helicase
MRLLREDANRKIVIFSAYADTVRYLESELHKRGVRVTGYTALEGTATRREAVRRNFDASLPPDQQTNDHDVLVSTDALSEGYNLHRAGIVINYDIPYNPTRVIQRIGRINRINKRVFDRLYIYNCFPTAIGEAETRIRQISTLKIKLFNAVIGSDTRTLTQDEELASYFKDEYDRSERDGDQLSWDAKHREAYDRARGNAQVMEAALKLPHRSRVRRKGMGAQRAVVFGKKGGQVVFTVAADESGAEVVSVERALPFFSAEPSEEGIAIDSDFADVFRVAKEKLFAKHELPPVKGRRAKAVKILTALGGALPEANHYCQDLVKIIRTLDDISEGTLKDIGQLNLKDLAAAFVELQRLVPAEFVRNVFDRAERERGERELLLFAEEFRA